MRHEPTGGLKRRLGPAGWLVCPVAARSHGSFVHSPGATTLLASVEPCSQPERRPARNSPPPPGSSGWSGVQYPARLVASLGIPRPSAMNIAPRWQAAWWRGRSIRRDAGLVLNTARRRQAPPWHPTHRSPDPSVRLTVGLRPRLSATAFPVRQKKLADLLARPSHPDDGSACPECPAAKSTAKNDCRRRRAVRCPSTGCRRAAIASSGVVA